MILYAHSHKIGARKLSQKYHLRYASPKQYITEKDLKKFGVVIHRDSLIAALQSHPSIYAYVLPNLQVYFHPDTAVAAIAEGFQKYFGELL